VYGSASSAPPVLSGSRTVGTLARTRFTHSKSWPNRVAIGRFAVAHSSGSSVAERVSPEQLKAGASSERVAGALADWFGA
jgi:hypothetical protein